jgi:DNA-binding NarL/FixJ family response regulator
MIRLVLADDRALVREGIRRVLADFPDIGVIAETSRRIDLLDLLERTTGPAPTTVLLGVVDDWARIIAMIPSLRRSGLNVLVLATEPDQRYVGRAVSAGAAGAVTTDATPAELAEALRRAATGRRPRRGRSGTHSTDRQDERPLKELSSREFEVMRMLGSGRSVVEAAERLGLSPKTVGTYRSRIMDKLGLRGTAELVRFVLERGLAE